MCEDGVMAGKRDQHRAETVARILTAARDQVAAQGAGMSMRAVAREVGLVSSAIYRYFPSREALLTEMIIESYHHLDERLSRVDGGAEKESGDASPAQRWAALAGALRGWARSVPHEFQLIYGTPLPDYVAPPETVPAAAAVAAHFLEVGAAAQVAGFGDAILTSQMKALVDDGLAAQASGAAAVLAELAALVGFVTLELGGHLVGSADPGDPLFDALVRRQTGTLGLS